MYGSQRKMSAGKKYPAHLGTGGGGGVGWGVWGCVHGGVRWESSPEHFCKIGILSVNNKMYFPALSEIFN